MSPQTTPEPDQQTRQGTGNALCISPVRLMMLESRSQAAGGLTVPKSDEEAWGGTEIDVRRTVL